MKWLLRHWPGVVCVLLSFSLTAIGVAGMRGVRHAFMFAFVAAVVCLFMGIASRFVPLDIGSYADKLRDHALGAYRIWRTAQTVDGAAREGVERTAFGTIDWLFAQILFLDRRLYAPMTKDEQTFWCAYLRHHMNGDATTLDRNRRLRRLYVFLREQRTTEKEREALVAEAVLRTGGEQAAK